MHRSIGARAIAVTLVMAALLCWFAAPAFAGPRAAGAAGVRAAAADDIPGTPEPVPFDASGTLQGPDKIDDVYAVVLAAGDTLNVTMSGATGTHFDIYLYPPGTPTVVNSDAFVAKNEDANDSKSLSYTVPSDAAGTYYIDVFTMDFADPNGTYILSATLGAQPTTITIDASPTSVKYPKPFVLSGLLTPGLLHDPCAAEVKKPGSGRWSYSSARLAYATSGNSALWWYRYTPNLKGVYNFRVRFAGVPGRLASLSRVIAVTVRK